MKKSKKKLIENHKKMGNIGKSQWELDAEAGIPHAYNNSDLEFLVGIVVFLAMLAWIIVAIIRG